MPIDSAQCAHRLSTVHVDSLHFAEVAAEGDHEEEEDEADGTEPRAEDDDYLLLCQDRVLCGWKGRVHA